MRRPVLIATIAAALALAVGAWAVDCWAPPQDLPWKPFDFDQPIGLATHFKLARIAADDRACQAALEAGGIGFEPLPPRREGECSVLDGVKLGDGPAPLNPARPVMSCGQALAFAVWERHAVQPAARRLLGAQVVRIEHLGTYNCRPIRGEASQLSQHAFANAIDVAAFDLAGHRQVSVLRDYRDPGPPGAFLRRVHADGCRVFGHSLGPDFNADHRNHLHLDMGPWGWCR